MVAELFVGNCLSELLNLLSLGRNPNETKFHGININCKDVANNIQHAVITVEANYNNKIIFIF